MPGPGKQWERTLEMLQKMNQRAPQAVFPLSDWLVRVDTSHLYIYIYGIHELVTYYLLEPQLPIPYIRSFQQLVTEVLNSSSSLI